MRKLARGIYSLLVLGLSLGCAIEPKTIPPELSLFTTKTFSAPSDRSLEVNTGEILFLQGIYIEGESIWLEKPVDMLIPGSMFIPFPVHIDSGRLTLDKIDNTWKYFSARDGGAAAWFPGLGSMINRGDTVGIRISLDGSRHEWFVNNTNHNNGLLTIWSKEMSNIEKDQYKPSSLKTPLKVRELVSITFDGYYGNQLHFTWEEISGSYRDSKKFVFDYFSNPTEIGIKGIKFAVVEANNSKLVYRWIDYKIEIEVPKWNT